MTMTLASEYAATGCPSWCTTTHDRSEVHANAGMRTGESRGGVQLARMYAHPGGFAPRILIRGVSVNLATARDLAAYLSAAADTAEGIALAEGA